jgi:hypothetical protein
MIGLRVARLNHIAMFYNQIGFVTVLIVLGSARSSAQAPGSQTELLDSASPSNLQSLLRSMNVQFTDSTKDNTTTYTLKLYDQDVALIASKADLRLSLELPRVAQLDRVNLWNSLHRFSRAYVDVDGLPHLEADLDVSNGVTRKGIQTFITSFGSTAKIFPTEIFTSSGPVNLGATKTRIGVPYGEFALWINPKEWQQSDSRQGRIGFRQLNGEGYAMIISEPGVVPNGLSGLKTAIFANVKNNVPDMKVTLDDKRTVTGHDVLYLGMEGTVDGVPLRYLYYAYSGSSGTIQILTYTSKDTFEKNLPTFTELLNGLEIGESVADSSGQNETGRGRITVPSGKAVIDFDKSKWKILSSPQVGRYLLSHSSGEAFAQVIWESLEFPPDALTEAAIKNLKLEDPNPKVTFKGKFVVNGVEVIQMNIEASIQGQSISYRNYYYSGKAGSIQIMTWTKPADTAKYGREVLDFLQGFRVTE